MLMPGMDPGFSKKRGGGRELGFWKGRGGGDLEEHICGACP